MSWAWDSVGIASDCACKISLDDSSMIKLLSLFFGLLNEYKAGNGASL